MQKVLQKRILRDFKANIARYLALGFLIILSMYLVVSMLGSAETIIRGSLKSDEKSKVEDGQFSLFVPMKDEEWKKLEDKGITLEKMFFMDYTLEDGSTIRLFKNREHIDKMILKEGDMAATENEIVLERRYAEMHDIKPGDTVKFGDRTFKVTGIGTVPDYDSMLKSLGDTGCDSKNFGLGFVDSDTYDVMRNEGKSVKSEEYYYAYRLNDSMTDDELKDELKKLEFDSEDVKDEFFQDYWNRTLGRKDELKNGIDELLNGATELRNGINMLPFNNEGLLGGADKLCDGIQELKDETDDNIDKLFDSDAGNLLSFVKAGDNVRIQAASGDQELYRSVGIIAGCIILVLISYVLSVFVVHSIDQESSVIGALYALGVNKKDLMRHYVMLPTIIAAVSGVIGTLIAYSDAGVRIQMQDCYNYYSLPDLKVMVMPYLIIYGIIAPPIICFIVTSLVINKRLSRTVLSLMKNEQKVSRGKDIRLKNMKFIRLFKIRQLLRERRTAFTVVFGMFVSLLIAVMAVEVFVYCNNVRIQYPEDTKYEYMYSYKYPSEVPPEGGYKAYAKTMKKSIYGYNFDVTVMGITDDNPFFDVDLEDSQGKVTISSSVMYKYGLKEGDVITLKDEENDRNYAFEISGVTQYSPGFMVFMPYDKALELFDEQDDYYNVVFADHDLNIESGRLYSTTTKENVKEAAGIFVNQMKAMIVMLGVVAVLIFAIVLYLMMKVMVDRSSYSIALIKIFGYRNRELKKMYLDGNFYVVVIGALISVPLAKLIMDAIYEPALAPNVACGVDKSFPIWIYIIIYAAIFILYFIINNLLVRRIKHMLPAEVLKNRE